MDREQLRRHHRRRLGGSRRDRPRHQGRRPRRGRSARSSLLDSGKLRVAEKIAGETGRILAGEPVAQEGGAAVLPPQRHDDHPGRARRHHLVGQGTLEVRELVPGRIPRRRVPRRAPLRRPPLGLHRARRRADAMLRQSRRLCQLGRWWTPGRPSAPAPRSARTCIFRAASASAGCSSRCRPTPPSSRTTASSALRGRRGRHRRTVLKGSSPPRRRR